MAGKHSCCNFFFFTSYCRPLIHRNPEGRTVSVEDRKRKRETEEKQGTGRLAVRAMHHIVVTANCGFQVFLKLDTLRRTSRSQAQAAVLMLHTSINCYKHRLEQEPEGMLQSWPRPEKPKHNNKKPDCPSAAHWRTKGWTGSLSEARMCL